MSPPILRSSTVNETTMPTASPRNVDEISPVSELSNLIDSNLLRNTIAEIIQNETRRAFGINNIPHSEDTDQEVEIGFDRDLSGLDKIPDVVNSLREFSGNSNEYGSWKKSVERILNYFEPLKGTTKYYGILNVVRNKIVGNADSALEAYSTPLNWDRIVKCLNLHYSDKRDLSTLEYQMTTMVQRGSIRQFYEEVNRHLSMILNKISAMYTNEEALEAMTNAYRDKALDTFIRGLKGDLPRLLSTREPTDLQHALHLCMKLENMNYRIDHSQTNKRQQSFSYSPPHKRVYQSFNTGNTRQDNPSRNNFTPNYHQRRFTNQQDQFRPNFPRNYALKQEASEKNSRYHSNHQMNTNNRNTFYKRTNTTENNTQKIHYTIPKNNRHKTETNCENRCKCNERNQQPHKKQNKNVIEDIPFLD